MVNESMDVSDEASSEDSTAPVSVPARWGRRGGEEEVEEVSRERAVRL